MVCRPPELGGLGISDLKNLIWALRMRLCAALPTQVPVQVQAFFSIASKSEVGNGFLILFFGLIIGFMDGASPILLPDYSQLYQREECSDAPCWRPSPIAPGLQIYKEPTQWPDVEDVRIWQFSANGQFSAKTAYKSLFLGATQFRPLKEFGTLGHLFLWLVDHNRCWTADRLQQRGLPHPKMCPLCDRENETINHVTVSYSHSVFMLSPQPTDDSLDTWWERTSEAASGMIWNGLNSLIILEAWTIWKHRNRYVFDGATPSITEAFFSFGREGALAMVFGRGWRDFLLDYPTAR
ncbi:hypothetical protein EJB05_10024, partial [Eragrostis curvula]